MCVYICSLFLFLFLLLLLDVEFLAIILAILIVKLSVAAAADDAASCVFVICEKVYVFLCGFLFVGERDFCFGGSGLDGVTLFCLAHKNFHCYVIKEFSNSKLCGVLVRALAF